MLKHPNDNIQKVAIQTGIGKNNWLYNYTIVCIQSDNKC